MTQKRDLAHTNESPRYYDDARGIRNVAVKEHSGTQMQQGEGPLEGYYRKRWSIPALSKRKRTKKAENDDMNQMEEAEEVAMEQVRRRSQEVTMKQVLAQKQASRAALPKISGFARFAGLGAVWTMYLWLQLPLAVISLVGFAVGALVAYYKEETWVGWFVNLFVDLDKYVPANSIGFGCWALCTILSISAFIVFLLWYEFSGVHAFGSLSSTAITFFFLAMSILPITNIFPWIPGWVMYMSARSAASMLHLFENG